MRWGMTSVGLALFCGVKENTVVVSDWFIICYNIMLRFRMTWVYHVLRR